MAEYGGSFKASGLWLQRSTFNVQAQASSFKLQPSTTLIILLRNHDPAIFRKLLPVASSHSLRVICLARRDYPGSSPYTDEKIRIIRHGSHDERTKFLHTNRTFC